MISIKTDCPKLEFYYEDIISYTKQQNSILNIEKNSKKIYKEILQNEYQKYTIIGQSIWNQYSLKNFWNQIWNNTFYSYCWPENNNILYILLHLQQEPMITFIDV